MGEIGLFMLDKLKLLILKVFTYNILFFCRENPIVGKVS